MELEEPPGLRRGAGPNRVGAVAVPEDLGDRASQVGRKGSSHRARTGLDNSLQRLTRVRCDRWSQTFETSITTTLVPLGEKTTSNPLN